MAPTIRIFRSEKLICETSGILGETLLDRISAENIFIDAPCGGKGSCGKCLVRLSPQGVQVLACRTYVDGDADIYLPEEMEMEILGSGETETLNFSDTPCRSTDKKKLGVAVDIGTTTVVAHLTDMTSGKRIATVSGVNAQRQFGADVISRIQYCADNGHIRLTKVIREQLENLIHNACKTSGESPGDITYISIAANSVMQHLCAGYSPVSMGVAPFDMLSNFGDEHPAWEGLHASKGAKVYYAPTISAYVGGDITAGLLAAGLKDTDCTTVYVDIGTNGELVMKLGKTYYCCATAAGPAFEGAEITMGMAAVSGAISRVSWDNGLKISVVGDKEPVGICGSGLLDSLAVLLETGAIDETGRLLDADEIEHEISELVEETDGENIFWLSKTGKGVHISSKDIRKLQLAKSAIAAGIETLIKQAGISEHEVKSFIIAGGFGSFMSPLSAAKIGLFPKKFLPITKTVGNTAGEGAALALLSPYARVALDDISDRSKHVELSISKIFNEAFIEHILFP